MSEQDQAVLTIDHPLGSEDFANMRADLDNPAEEMFFNSDMEREINFLTAFGVAVDDSDLDTVVRDLRSVLLADIDRVEEAVASDNPLIEVDSESDPDFVTYSVTTDYDNELLRSFARISAAFVV